MGDTFRIIVDSTASPQEAPVLAKEVMDYMIGRRIIQAERGEGVLGKDGGYRPGENVEEALASWTPHHSPGGPLAIDKIASDLRRWATNGVEETIGRTVFHNFGAGLDVVRCPVCQANNVESDWGDAVGRWYRGDDLAPFQCRSCNESSPLTDWTFDPPWAFGHLGFEFWNWPPMKRSFIDKIAGILGHKVVLVAGKV